MKELTCPNCGNPFKIDQSGYSDIIKQVRTHEFDKEIENYKNLAEKEKENAVKLAKVHTENEFTKLNEISIKENSEKLIIKDKEISELKSVIKNADDKKQLAILNATQELEKKNIDLTNQLKNNENDKDKLRAELELKHQKEMEKKNSIISGQKQEIDFHKDYKQKLSTKMVGESLEEHCFVEFNKLRSTAFPNAIFEKDNDASGGTKGDYIYREFDENGIEIISIMFEMKNENDSTATKKRNKDFFKKLDKDRSVKKCEYAVLVSTLEEKSDLYNSGIVDVSYKYKKMYVVRPQFFIPIITILKNAAMKNLKIKVELEMMKNRNIDLSNFENKIEDFKVGFERNREIAIRKHENAISEIDKAIIRLQKTKEFLTSSDNNIRLASNKLDNLTIKKLTYGNPTMKKILKSKR